LRRAVSTAAAGAATEAQFFTRLREAGVLVRIRTSIRDPDQVTGYAVALPGDTAQAGGPVWFGGAKLAADLSLTRLRSRWPSTSSTQSTSSGPRSGGRFTPEERTAIWEHAARAAQQATEQIHAFAVTDPGAASDAAWAAADTLHVAAAALGSRELRQAADSYSRAARIPYARIPRPSPAGDGLRRTARLLSAAAYAAQQDPAVLILRLAELIIAVAELREIQQRTAQATAARAAAGHLYTAAQTCRPASAPAQAKSQARTAAQLAAADFPTPLRLHRPAAPGPNRYEPAAPRPRAHRPRGPTR
jgi:hypothetical protein